MIYPIKSLPGISVSHTRILQSGALEHDRRWALFTTEGTVRNAKRSDRFHLIDCQFSSELSEVTLSLHGRIEGEESSEERFSLLDQQSELSDWFSDALGERVLLQENSQVGFPDDLEASGPTVISTATLQEVAAWFPGLSLESVRQRFRANLELAAPGPFWEDQLFGLPGQPRPFQMGECRWRGVNPCQRCVVPSRDPQSGERLAGFQKEFARKRAETLPATIPTAHFNHFYRLAVNTNVAADNACWQLECGAKVTL